MIWGEILTLSERQPEGQSPEKEISNRPHHRMSCIQMCLCLNQCGKLQVLDQPYKCARACTANDVMHLPTGVVEAVKITHCGNVGGIFIWIWLHPSPKAPGSHQYPQLRLWTKLVSKKRYLGVLTYIFMEDNFVDFKAKKVHLEPEAFCLIYLLAIHSFIFRWPPWHPSTSPSPSHTLYHHHHHHLLRYSLEPLGWLFM